MHDTGTKILKRDALGRIGYPRGRREALLDEFERSGLKGAVFARTVGINYQTFANWIQKRRHARGDYGAASRLGRICQGAAPRWLEAELPREAPAPAPAPAEPSAPLTVELRCGTRLLVGDGRQATLAALLIQALQTTASATPC